MGSATDSLYRKIQSLYPEQLAKVEALIASLQVEERDQEMLLLSEPALAAVWNDSANDTYNVLTPDDAEITQQAKAFLETEGQHRRSYCELAK